MTEANKQVILNLATLIDNSTELPARRGIALTRIFRALNDDTQNSLGLTKEEVSDVGEKILDMGMNILLSLSKH